MLITDLMVQYYNITHMKVIKILFIKLIIYFHKINIRDLSCVFIKFNETSSILIRTGI